MRILHTSDWHLGVSTGPASRVEEQRWFLDWLLGVLQAREVDVLVVAGDIFDTMQPSAEAQSLYYRFLARAESTGVRGVVIVGGNHDSPSRLDAPRELLEAVGARVVGGVPAQDEGQDPSARLDPMLIPLRRRGSDEVAAVCLAVPYVHEYRLGIRTTDLDRRATRAAFRAAFGALYTRLADRAAERFPGAPLIATGHLTLGTDATRDDYPQEIHQVGTIEGLDAAIIDPRVRYAALGHIHRSYPVKGSVAWYSGSPLPYSLAEMRTRRRVLLVELDDSAGAGEGARVEPLEVPEYRRLVEVAGSPDEVVSELEALSWEEPLPPLVHARVTVDAPTAGLPRRLHEAVARSGPAPVLVEILQRGGSADSEAEAPVVGALEDLSLDEVFAMVCQAKGVAEERQDSLNAAFRTLSGAEGERADSLIVAIAREVLGAAKAPDAEPDAAAAGAAEGEAS